MADDDVWNPAVLPELVHDGPHCFGPQQFGEIVVRPGMAWVRLAQQFVVADELPWSLFGGQGATDRDDLISSSMQGEAEVPHLAGKVLMNE